MSDLFPNRVTLLTAPGSAAIAVVRLSGPGVQTFLDSHFSKPLRPGRCVHGILRDGQRELDDIVAVLNEDRLDLNLHGSSWIVHSVMTLAEADGFVRSDLDAVDANSPIWRDVLESLPLAKTEQAVRMLLAQPLAWDNLERSPDDLRQILSDESGKWMLAIPRVAIVGPANVGKSTLANQLFGQARSITADLPGTTRDWVGEIANIDGLAIMLLDTPGLRATTDAIEASAIAASQSQIQSADLVILVFDQSQSVDQHLLDQFPDAICVANKADTASAFDAKQIKAIPTVATNGTGLDQLRFEIRRWFGWETFDVDRARWWTEAQRMQLASKIKA